MPISYPAGGSGTGGASKLSDLSDLDLTQVANGSVLAVSGTPGTVARWTITPASMPWALGTDTIRLTMTVDGTDVLCDFEGWQFDGFTLDGSWTPASGNPAWFELGNQIQQAIAFWFPSAGFDISATADGTGVVLDPWGISELLITGGTAMPYLGLQAGAPEGSQPPSLSWSALDAADLPAVTQLNVRVDAAQAAAGSHVADKELYPSSWAVLLDDISGTWEGTVIARANNSTSFALYKVLWTSHGGAIQYQDVTAVATGATTPPLRLVPDASEGTLVLFNDAAGTGSFDDEYMSVSATLRQIGH